MHDDIDRVAVLGAGNMGHGITEVAAIAGYDVVMRDVDEDVLADGSERIEWSVRKLAEKGELGSDPDAVLDRIDTTTDLERAVAGADVVIEAVPEKLALKRDVFTDLDEYTDQYALLATNTSSLSITDIAAATGNPGRVVGLHFFNPPVRIELVEVVYGEQTSDDTAARAYEFAESLGKTPIHVREDVNGFVVNSVLGPFVEEPAWMVSADEATIEQADAAMVHERGYPMGPFELADLTGIDVGYHIREEAGKPIPPVMEERVAAGDLGRKTGQGYYDYEGGEGASYEPADAEGFDWLRVEARMVNEAAKLVGDDVATPEAVDTGMRLGTGFPEGPCSRGDELGLDTVLGKLRDCRTATGGDRFEPAAFLVDLVDAGKTGADAGEGFYEYDG
jgi:enoyl-CoA hydratase/3-hydroxyacyl-CoA dehydrogenase